MPFEPCDFRVGLDIGICGRSIRIYDCDQYTREFFDVSTANGVNGASVKAILNFIYHFKNRN